jgi:catechol 2,3-dioxygenase-like lactoylglutathione lyase family enzyme
VTETRRQDVPDRIPRAKTSKRSLSLILSFLAAAGLLGGLVHAVLVAAHVSEPAAATVYGLTARRLSATSAVVLALFGVGIGGVALGRPRSRFGAASGRLGAGLALGAGLIAGSIGGVGLAIADGGPGSGNGVVGAAGALVLALVALALGGLALTRSAARAASPASAVVRYQVADVERSFAFYTGCLGFRPGPVEPSAAFGWVVRGELHLLLGGPGSSGSRPMPDGRLQGPGGWNRIVLFVDDLSAMVAELQGARVPFRNEVEVGPGGGQIQIEDPDGNPIELHERPALQVRP